MSFRLFGVLRSAYSVLFTLLSLPISFVSAMSVLEIVCSSVLEIVCSSFLTKAELVISLAKGRPKLLKWGGLWECPRRRTYEL